MFTPAATTSLSLLGGGLTYAGAVGLVFAIGYLWLSRRARGYRPGAPSVMMRTIDGRHVRVPAKTERLGREAKVALGAVSAVCLIIAGLVMNGAI
jgi:hypothetical protein